MNPFKLINRKTLHNLRNSNGKPKLVTAFEIVDDIVGNRSHGFQRSTFHHETWFRTLRLPLSADFLSLSLGISLKLIILDLPQAELLRAPRGHHMLHTHVNPLSDYSVSDLPKVFRSDRTLMYLIEKAERAEGRV